MRKSILRYFLMVLMTAMILCSLFFYFVFENLVLTMAKEEMFRLVKTIDISLMIRNEDNDFQYLNDVFDLSDIRLTLIDLDGTVLFDTGIDASLAENHSHREEVKDALVKGYSYSKRSSSSLDVEMLYLAYYNEQLSLVTRIAMPLSELNQYYIMVLPAILLSTLASLLISYTLARRLSTSISKPLNDIVDEMRKLENQDYDLNFRTYQFPELQMITSTTKHLAKNLQTRLLQLEREKRIRQTFFANASHELKTPLTSIKGYTELLENDLLNDEKTRQDVIYRLKKETDNMAHLIKDILMISRLESKDVKVTGEVIDVYQFLKETEKHFEPLIHQYDISLHIKCQWNLKITMDLVHLRALVDNLLTNAIKYNQPKGKVHVDAYSDGQRFILDVEDTGIGIPKKHQSHIFERFYRIDKGRSKKVGGTGLGLSIVKHIVQYYNGTITLVSEEGKGTKISATLPMIKNETRKVEDIE